MVMSPHFQRARMMTRVMRDGFSGDGCDGASALGAVLKKGGGKYGRGRCIGVPMVCMIVGALCRRHGTWCCQLAALPTTMGEEGGY